MDVYASLPFKVRGIGTFYNREGRQVVAKYADGEWTDIGVEDGINGGYVRANGDLVLVAGENVTCNDYYYKASQEFHLVVGLFEPYLLQNVLIECLKLTQSIPYVKILRTVTDKAVILADESIAANSLMWFKIVFVYSYDYVTNNCDVPLCGSSGNVVTCEATSDCIEFSGIRDLAILGNTTTLVDDIF